MANKVGFEDGAIIIPELSSAPANVTGHRILYAKTDGTFHSVKNDGTDQTLMDVSVAPSILATVTEVDLKTTGQTTLYTVPASKKLVITDIIIQITSADTATVAATVGVGKSPNYNEYCSTVALTNLLNNGTYLSLNTVADGSIRKSLSNGDVVKLDITVGATATTLTASVFVIGFSY